MTTYKRTVSATEARVHFGELIRRAREEGPITVERSGEPQVVVLSVEHYAQLESATNGAIEEPWEVKVREVRKMFRDHLQRTGATMPDAVEMIREGREIRDRQIEAREPSILESDRTGWRDAFAIVRSKIRAEFGNPPIDVDEMIHKMREERSAELLDGLR